MQIRAVSDRIARQRVDITTCRLLAPGKPEPSLVQPALSSVSSADGSANGRSLILRRGCVPGSTAGSSRPGTAARAAPGRRSPGGRRRAACRSSASVAGSSQRATVHGALSRREAAPYSLSSRYCTTSNCSGPTAPSSGTFRVGVGQLEALHHAFLEQLAQPVAEALEVGRHGVLQVREALRGEARDLVVDDGRVLGQRVADGEIRRGRRCPTTSPG